MNIQQLTALIDIAEQQYKGIELSSICIVDANTHSEMLQLCGTVNKVFRVVKVYTHALK